jgi:hypothetical protein
MLDLIALGGKHVQQLSSHGRVWLDQQDVGQTRLNFQDLHDFQPSAGTRSSHVLTCTIGCYRRALT